MSKRIFIFISIFLALTATALSSVEQSVNDYGKGTPSDVYALDYECDSMTTSGMAMWAVAMKQKEDAKVLRLTKKMAKRKDVNLSAALKSEEACWEKVNGEINKLNAGILELEYWFGGSIGAVAKAFAPLDVSFIRRASLEDDLDCLNGKSSETPRDRAGVDAKALQTSINTAVEEVDIANVDNELFTEYYGSKADYTKCQNLCLQHATQLKVDIQQWLNARKKVESLLSTTAKKAYRFHTYKVINSLANCMKNDIEG